MKSYRYAHEHIELPEFEYILNKRDEIVPPMHRFKHICFIARTKLFQNINFFVVVYLMSETNHSL